MKSKSASSDRVNGQRFVFFLTISLALNKNFFAKLLCVSTSYHFCGVMNDVGNNWHW